MLASNAVPNPTRPPGCFRQKNKKKMKTLFKTCHCDEKTDMSKSKTPFQCEFPSPNQ